MTRVIGIDFGTQSARALVADARSGEILGQHTVIYPPTGMEEGLARAEHYQAALWELLEHAAAMGPGDQVAGICVDATSLTLVPLNCQGKALSQLPGNQDLPHAQVKLWKYHRAQPQADEALALARELEEPFLRRTGFTISSEWMLPKLLQLRDQAPELYGQMDLALDLCEYLTFCLTGQVSRSVGSMGYKGLWSQEEGFPSEPYLNALRPGFSREYRRLLRGPVFHPGQRVGKLRPELCRRYGLNRDVAVGAGVLDGHTAPIALGALESGDSALVVGTSNVLAIQTSRPKYLSGVCGIAKDGLTPGMYGIDCGQSCTGDMLQWYVENAVPREVADAAKQRGCTVHQMLCQRIHRPWENQVAAADWWNGSRNAPCDLSRRGILSGLTLQTKPEDIYLALLQGIVCGTGEILDLCQGFGMDVGRLLVTGGIAHKNPLLMQQYADLLQREVLVGKVHQGPALGSAIFAAMAAGIYNTPQEAYQAMGIREFLRYTPDQAHRREYEALRKRNHLLRL